MISAIQLLKDCILFSSLNDKDLEPVANLATTKEYEAGSLMFSTGEVARELFVIREGRVAVQMTLPLSGTQGSRRVTVDVVTAGEIAGWSAILEPFKYTFTAVCMQSTVALAIDGGNLRHILSGNPKIGFEVMEGLAKVMAAALNDTRQVLISERLLAGKE